MQWKRQRVCSPLRRREGGRRDGPARLAASGPDAVGPVEEELVLPIFPLGLVALPYGVVPLHIFEARYRVLFSTLLHGESDIDEDLVQPESPFLASRRFGISCIFSRSEEDSTSSSTIASVGTIMNITKHEQLQDGQMDILCEGAHRFKILEVIEEKPVLLCRVQTFVDEDAEESEGVEMAAARAAIAATAGGEAEGDLTELEKYSEEVKELFLTLINMAAQIKGNDDESQRVEIKNMSPEALSFFLSSLFSTTQQKQALIEVTSTRTRLEMCKNVLEESLKVYSAASAIQGAFDEETDEGAGAS